MKLNTYSNRYGYSLRFIEHSFSGFWGYYKWVKLDNSAPQDPKFWDWFQSEKDAINFLEERISDAEKHVWNFKDKLEAIIE